MKTTRCARFVRQRICASRSTNSAPIFEAERGLRFDVRIGVNTGEVIAGDNASDGTLATGDAVTVAARLQQEAAAGDVIVGQATERLVRATVTLEPLAPIEAKGKSAPVPAFRLLSLAPGSRREARSVAPRLVGRQVELARLGAALDEVTRSRKARVVAVVGHAGVGKSRLVTEFTQSVGRQARCLRGRCLPYGEGVTYYPLMELIQSATGVAETDNRATARAKLAMIVPESDDAGAIGSAIEAAIGLDRGSVNEDKIFWATRGNPRRTGQGWPAHRGRRGHPLGRARLP